MTYLNHPYGYNIWDKCILFNYLRHTPNSKRTHYNLYLQSRYDPPRSLTVDFIGSDRSSQWQSVIPAPNFTPVNRTWAIITSAYPKRNIFTPTRTPISYRSTINHLPCSIFLPRDGVEVTWATGSRYWCSASVVSRCCWRSLFEYASPAPRWPSVVHRLCLFGWKFKENIDMSGGQ